MIVRSLDQELYFVPCMFTALDFTQMDRPCSLNVSIIIIFLGYFNPLMDVLRVDTLFPSAYYMPVNDQQYRAAIQHIFITLK